MLSLRIIRPQICNILWQRFGFNSQKPSFFVSFKRLYINIKKNVIHLEAVKLFPRLSIPFILVHYLSFFGDNNKRFSFLVLHPEKVPSSRELIFRYGKDAASPGNRRSLPNENCFSFFCCACASCKLYNIYFCGRKNNL